MRPAEAGLGKHGRMELEEHLKNRIKLVEVAESVGQEKMEIHMRKKSFRVFNSTTQPYIMVGLRRRLG